MRTAGILGSITAVVLIGFYFLSGTGGKPLVASASKPWVEVTAAKAFAVEADGSTLKELRTGDELDEGVTIRSDAGGKATIHLPDGSALRLDSNSTLVLEAARLAADETLTLRATLLSGRVWSKVVGLATPRSSWEVKTSNAVATVRGTAFLTEYRNGATKVFSAERTVEVKALDPVSKASAEGKGTLVAENTLLEIDDKTARAIAAKQATAEAALAAKAPPKELLNERFVKENATEDKELDEAIEAIKKEAKGEARVRQELREEVKARKAKAEALRKERNSEREIVEKLEKEEKSLDELRKRVRERLQEDGLPVAPREEGTKEGEVEEKKTETSSSIDGGTEESGAVKAESSAGGILPAKPAGAPSALVIETKASSRAFTDGDKIAFRAVLLFPDGARLDVTDKALWKSVGNVGIFQSPGGFLVKLRDEDSELGEIKGGVEAAFQYEGTLFNAVLFEFTAMPFVEETELRG